MYLLYSRTRGPVSSIFPVPKYSASQPVMVFLTETFRGQRIFYFDLPLRRSVLGDRCLPPWKPCMIIFTGCLGLKWDAYSDSRSVTSNKSGFFCVSLRKTRKRITHGLNARDDFNILLRDDDRVTENKGGW